MRLVLLTMPLSKASIIPSLMPVLWPKSSALTMRCFVDGILRGPQVFDNFSKYSLSSEVFVSYSQCCPAMPVIIGSDGFERCKNVVHGIEREQTFTCR